MLPGGASRICVDCWERGQRVRRGPNKQFATDGNRLGIEFGGEEGE